MKIGQLVDELDHLSKETDVTKVILQEIATTDANELVETVKARIKQMINRNALQPMLEECKAAEDAYEMHNEKGNPTFSVKLYRPCPGKTAIPFFHGATGPIVRGKVLFHGDRENPSIVSISCKQFRKWVDWFRSRPSLQELIQKEAGIIEPAAPPATEGDKNE